MVSKKFSRVLSGIMAFLMVLSILPVNVFATGANAEEPADTMDVTVTVVTADSEKKAIQGATVSIEGVEGSITTGEDGSAVFKDLTVGTVYTVMTVCNGYSDDSREFTCESDSVLVELEKSKHDIVLTVVNDDGNAVSGASVKMAGEDRGTTNDEGKVTLKALTYGENYIAEVECTGYESVVKKFVCNADTVENGVSVPLTNRKLNIVLTVTDQEGNAISGAKVKIAEENRGVTDNEGKVTLEALTYGETYIAEVKCEGYGPESVEFICKDDTAASVQLTAYTKITITGIVRCEGIVVEGAEVTLNLAEGEVQMTETTKTDAEGKFSFENVYQELIMNIAVNGDPYQETILAAVEEDNQIDIDKKVFTISAEPINYEGDGTIGGTVEVSASEVKYGEGVKITINAVQKDGQSTHSIYYITDNGEIVAENCSGETSYEYEIENITEDHTVSVIFSRDTEVITFWVDSEGNVYVKKNGSDEFTKIELWRIGRLTIDKELASDEETGEEKTDLRVSYSPSKNYRVSSVTIDENDAVEFNENDQAYAETESFCLGQEEMRKYVIKVQSNHFTVELAEDVAEEVTAAIVMNPEDGIVNYNKDVKLSITPPEDKYLSALTVATKSNGTESADTVDVLADVVYDGNLPVYTLQNVRDNKIIYAEFSDITELEKEAGKNPIDVETSGSVYKEESDTLDIYYLAEQAKIRISSEKNDISRRYCGMFFTAFEVSVNDTIEKVYLLNGNTITKVTTAIQTVVDVEAPKITCVDFENKSPDNKSDNKITGVTWTITAADNEGGSGIARVVYSKNKDLNEAEIKALETLTEDHGNGTYSYTFENDKGYYYFWAIDNLGHVSAVSDECYVDSDVDAPEILSFTSEGYRSFTLTTNDVEITSHYPKEEGVRFTVKVSDALSDITAAELQLGDTFTKPMERTGTEGECVIYEVSVTPAEYNELMASDETEELKVTVVATDDSQNTNESKPYSLDQKLIFEEKKPEISISIPDAVQVGDANWYRAVDGTNADVTLIVTIEDTGAGLNTGTIRISNNGEEIFPGSNAKSSEGITVLYTDENGNEWSVVPEAQKAVKAVFTIQAYGEANAVTSFDFGFEAKDNEGNLITCSSKDNSSLKFSIDGVLPVIEKFDIGVYTENAEDNFYAEQESKYDVEATEYGYFFHDATKITVFASDVGSGVKTIYFYAIKNGELEKSLEQETEKLVADGDRWYAVFEVEEGFKGQIYAYAVDNVENSNSVETGKNAHPEDLTITESNQSHNAFNKDNETRHVVLSLPEATVKDKNGTPLFTLVQYDEEGTPVIDESGIPVTVTVRDTFNGIKEVWYTVKVPGEEPREYSFDTENVILAEYLEGDTKFFNDGTDFNNGEGLNWIVTGMEKNLITEITTELPVKDNRNGIEVIVEMTDMANNKCSNLSPYEDKNAEPLMLSIDNDAPVINVVHIVPSEQVEENVSTKGAGIDEKGKSPYFVGFDPNNLTDGYKIYDNSTLQFKITERNFINGDMSNLSEEDQTLLNELMTVSAKKVLVNKNIKKNAKEADIYADLAEELKYFGPFYDDTQGTNKVRCNAVYPYVDDSGKYYGDSVYYLVELRNCYEDKVSGTYETSIQVSDLLRFSNEAVENFVIDELAPVISITFDNNSVRNGKYYNADRTATITVVERNFNNESGEISGTASDDGREVDFPLLSRWSDSKDYVTHTATVSFTTDALYQNFGASYIDLAGRESEATVDEFYVDKTMPVISITGVLDKSANNGTVAPDITYTDTNIDLTSIEITLTGANNGAVEYDAVKEAINHGERYVYDDFDHEKPIDDVYTLYVRALDMAGNAVTQTIRFSCNRFGSVFDLSNIKDMLGKYNQKERTIVVTETNVDEIDLDAVRVTLTKNGTPADLILGEDFTVEMVGGEGTWHQYTYKILSNLFEDDGTYSLYFYTEDMAGNINENIDESKEAQISFGIDKTKPIATPIDFESDTQYALESKTVSVEIKDNLLLEGVKIYLNDKEITYIVDGDNYIFDIPMSNTKQTVKILAVDAAGNEEELFVKDFLVTTNLFVRWYNNTPLFIGSMVLLALILIVLVWRIIVVILKKRNNDEEEI